MNSKIALSGLISLVFSLVFLSACGKNFQVSSSPNTVIPAKISSSGSSQSLSVSDKILQDVSTGLAQNSGASQSLGLNPTQVAGLVQTAASVIEAGGLKGTTHLPTLLPVLIQGLTQALGGLQLPAAGATMGSGLPVASIVGLVGNLVLGSVAHLNGVVLTAEIVQVVSQALFQNLPAAGVNGNQLSQVAGSLMNGLVGHLGQQGLPVTVLTDLLQALSAGAALGVGNLNLASIGGTLLNDVLQQIGLGSAQGLTHLIGSNGNSDVLQTLIGAVVHGTHAGLTQTAGAQPSLGMDITQLLSSLVSGQTAGLNNSALPSIKQQVVGDFLQLLLARI